MKKVILIVFIAIVSLVNGVAQVDMNFENWTTVPLSLTVQDPNGWVSFNAATALGMTQSVYKETTAPIPAGLAAAKIVTRTVPASISIPNPLRPGHNFDTVGLLGVGLINLANSTMTFGNGMPAGVVRPAMLSFSSKYTPATGSQDSAYVVAFVTRWNTSTTPAHRDTIGRGIYRTGANTTTYAANSLTMTYASTFFQTIPDSMHIYISSSRFNTAGATVGSAFYIDNLAWSGYTNVNEVNGNSGSVSVFPNPSNGKVNLISSVNATLVNITDISGRTVGTYTMLNNKTEIQTEQFTSGIYFYSVMNDRKEIINRGKFEVIK